MTPGHTHSRRRRRTRHQPLLDEIDAMAVGDCLRWRTTATARQVQATLSFHHRRSNVPAVLRVLAHAGELFIVRLA